MVKLAQPAHAHLALRSHSIQERVHYPKCLLGNRSYLQLLRLILKSLFATLKDGLTSLHRYSKLMHEIYHLFSLVILALHIRTQRVAEVRAEMKELVASRW